MPGLENRTRCYQIPVFYEVHNLLEGLKDLPVFFGMVGHGMLLEQMGMFDSYMIWPFGRADKGIYMIALTTDHLVHTSFLTRWTIY